MTKTATTSMILSPGKDIYYGKDSVEVAYTALFEQAIILTN